MPKLKTKTSTNAPVNAPVLEPGRIVDVPLDLLMRDETQPRTDFNAEALNDLAASIKARGVKHPIVVRGDYVIEDGERRYRAAKLAGLATVPCILAGGADDKQPQLERALDQVAQNTLREPLNPMEWARFFLRLRAEFNLTVDQMSDTMEARGIKMSRPYISNLMRLAQLPEWAQQKIGAGELTAAHGKVLLTAQASPKVLKIIEKELKRDPNARTTDELQDEVTDAFHESHINLNRKYGDDAPLFNTKQCDSCESCATFAAPYNREKMRFCLNEAHFKELQTAAKAQAKKKDTKSESVTEKDVAPAPLKQPKLNAGGVYIIKGVETQSLRRLENAKFDTTVCANCEWRHAAAYRTDAIPFDACFNVPEFEAKQSEAQRGQGRERCVADHFDNWVRAQIVPRLSLDQGLQFRLLTYLAIGQPGSITGYVYQTAPEITEAAGVTNLGEHLQVIDDTGFPADRVLPEALNHLDRGELYHFARYAGVKLNADTYQIDAGYIALGKKADLRRLLQGAAGAPDESAKLAELAAFCLRPEVIKAIGVPREITRIWESHDIAARRDDEDDSNDDNQTEEETC